MDGVHDLGGKQGFGEVNHKINEYEGGKTYSNPFHHDWEHLPYSVMFAAVAEMGAFSVDEVRHVVERIAPVHYLATPYYERYVIGVATLLVEKGFLTHAELEALAGGPFPLALPLTSPGRPARTDRQEFSVGDKVRVRDEFFAGHIRMPAYCRGRTGVVRHRTADAWPFPDSIGHGRTDGGAEPTYNVEFTGKELFGEDTDAASIMVDLFEGYLEPAS
ncbi:nitrile hydratase subunit beta [Rhodococcus sp. NPDC003322]